MAAIHEAPDNAALFTHFIAINTIVGAALGRDETISCRPGYASVTEISVSSGEIQLVSLGAEMGEGRVS